MATKSTSRTSSATFPALALVLAPSIIIVILQTATTTSASKVLPVPTRRVSDDYFMDPCKAEAYWGDIALSDEDYAMLQTRLQKKRGDSDNESLDIVNNDTQRKSHQEELDETRKKFLQEKSELSSLLKKRRREVRTSCKKEKDKKACRASRMLQRQKIKKLRVKLRKVERRLRKGDKIRRRARKLRGLSTNRQNRKRKLMRRLKKGQDRSSIHQKPQLDNTTRRRDRRSSETAESAESRDAPKSRKRRAATAKSERLWDYGVIPYMIEANFSGATKALFKLGMRHWENYTCITFKEKEPEDQHYILFSERTCGCCSFVGKAGNGAQVISIGKNCDKFGIVVHELGHVIGFWHEHTRPDRDYHVQIIYKNIMPGQEYNFNMLPPSDVNSLGETYDFGSIMHYAQNTFARDASLDTILPRRKTGVTKRPEIGQRRHLSPGDIRQANKLYRCPVCGKTMLGASDTFSHTPQGSRPELCRWRISATHGEKIVLNISRLDVPKSYNCERDYLEVRDGNYIKSPLLGRYCGDNVPETLTSTGYRLWLEYRTQNGGGNGFSAAYEAICGGEILKDEGYLTSPNYPDSYRANKVCIWKITVGEKYTIENHDRCVYDYLEVRDGPNEDSPLIGNYCGYKIPEDIKSTGRHLYVKFFSDGSVQKMGFAATFVKEYDECEDEHGCDHVCVNTLGSYMCSCRIGYELHSDGKRCEDACGGYIDAENGTINSPSYMDLYPPNKNCVWQIVALEDHKININFTHFDLEGNNQECEYDSVRLSSGVGKDLKLLGVFCGYTFPAPVTSEGNTLRIEFNSDNSVQKTGFSATFTTDKDECAVLNGGCQHVCKNTVGSYQCACHNGFTLHDDGHGCKEGGCKFDISSHYGTITSPNYPEYYPSRKDCVWHFTTVPGHRIRLRFEVFELEPHQECTYDHVLVYDGEDSNARQLGMFCGAIMPEPVTSSGNKMFMLFFSDASVQRKGFEAIHDTVCGANLEATATPQKLVSHARYGDHHYDNGENCEWKIRAKDGHRILLRFTAFDLEDEAECGYDKVEIFDGPDVGDKIGQYCGSASIKDINSKGQSLLIYFTSDDTINWKGFSATYQLISPPPDFPEAGGDQEEH
ncbi:hypothetical protein EGW08_009508 [Elysia chlorotica]|uniref:Metalloendopeptidase n=1 Tax=Elysia chlorotica TaxID=188477 RepID=A0A3S1BFW4_ELYCH|nr:hypothetical protein EGW08_009508 [Elysia chlorotica]